MSEQPTPVGPDLASGPFAKVTRAEDANGDGLTERPSVAWLLWCSDALTAFCNGFLSGVPVGAFVGGANAATTDSLNPQVLSLAVVYAGVLTASGNGIKHFMIWHAANPMPNPFRASA